MEKLEQQLPQTNITTLYEEKQQEERDLESALEKEKITSDSLANMCLNRKVSLILIPLNSFLESRAVCQEKMHRNNGRS